MKPVPGHPHASYSVAATDWGTVVIKCYCAACRAEYRRECVRPKLANSYVLRFAQLHGHGYRPSVRR